MVLQRDDLMLAAQACRVLAQDLRRDAGLQLHPMVPTVGQEASGTLLVESAKIWEEVAKRLDEEDDV